MFGIRHVNFMRSVSRKEFSDEAVLISLIDKVRLLYDRGQPTARLVLRSKKDLDTPLVRLTSLAF